MVGRGNNKLKLKLKIQFYIRDHGSEGVGG